MVTLDDDLSLSDSCSAAIELYCANDTSLIRIMNGIWPTYRWDGNGLSAYNFGTDSSGNITTINYNKYVRFDQYGIYGINAEDGWIASSIDEVKQALPQSTWSISSLFL